MFERFTEQARHVVVYAQEEARGLGHPHIGTEHELLGLLRDPDTIAGRALAAAGLTVDGARDGVVAILGRRDESAEGQIPFTPRAKAVLEGALREALKFGHFEVGPAHLLLSLTQRADGNGVKAMREAGADPETVAESVRQLLATEPPPQTPPPSRGGVTPRFSAGPDREAVVLLRAAAARAIAAGRDSYGPDDLRAALAGD